MRPRMTEEAVAERAAKQRQLAQAAKSTGSAGTGSDHTQKDGAKAVLDGVKRWQALGRLPAGELNNTEKAFSAYLQERQAAGAILWWRAHPFNVRLADNLFYRPDFIALLPTMELVIYEVKGGYTSEKGQMKIKLCAEALPVFKMIKASKRKGGGWDFQEF